MNMDQPQATDVDRLLVQACQDADVLPVLLYGSVARGEQTARSDIDVCLVLLPRGTPYDSTLPSRKRLEYLTHFNLDVQIFQALFRRGI
jgi:predicted nucleotidyltransferase